MHDVLVAQELVELAALLLGNVVDVHGDVVAELLGDLLQTEAGGLGPEEVDHGQVHDAPAHDHQVVFPADVHEADGRRLQQDQRRRELPEQAEAHADGPDLGREDLGHVQVHGRVAEGALEGQVQEHDEDAAGVAALFVRVACICGQQGAEDRGCDQTSEGAEHVHEAAGVDFVVEPCATWVVDQTCGGRIGQ